MDVVSENCARVDGRKSWRMLVAHDGRKQMTVPSKSALKVMLLETIRNEDKKCNTALQHCYDIVSNGSNILPTLQRCVALKIVIANCPV